MLGSFSLVEQLSDAFVTVEDKGPSVLWVCLDDSLLRHWFFQQVFVPSRWEALALNPSDVLSQYRGILSKNHTAPPAPPEQRFA